VVKIIGDHAQADPSLHATVALIEATPKTVSTLEKADATLSMANFKSLLKLACRCPL
jgi:hypothetical protein